MPYLSVRLYPVNLETPPNEYLTEKGTQYMHQTRTSGGSPESMWYAVGYPNQFLRTGSTLPQINPSRFKIGFILHKASSSAVSPTVLNAFAFSLKDPNNTPYLRTGSYAYSSLSTSSVTLSYNTGITDTKTGLPIYFNVLNGQYTTTDTAATLIFPTANYIYTQNDFYTNIDPRIIPTDLMNDINDGVWDYESFDSSDPYVPAGISETGGGDGNFDDTTDIIPIPPLPTESVSDTGFVNIYNPNLTQLKALATYMWTNPAFDLTNWKALVANPLDSIISLSIVPVAVPDGGTKTITVGNVATTVSMTQAATNYIELNCGTINIEKYWGCYLDYSPYTKISLYLPYIGYNTLNIDEVMGNSLQVVYHIDIFTGGCVAFVVCGGSVLYSFPGNIAYNIPVTGADYSRVISGIVGSVSQGVTAIASGGLTAPLAVGAVASMATTVISSKPSINKGGGISGNVGILGVQKPYVEIIRPRQALPQNQNLLQGYPSLIYSRLGDLTGYTEIESINLENVNATDEEKTEIFNLLNTGVIL